MSHRLQVIINTNEYSLIRKASSSEGKKVSEWIRGLIRHALSRSDVKQRHDLIQRMRDIELPSPSIEQMLKEIDQGSH